MCTAITYSASDHYFGRNLDYEHSFGEKIVITPRNFPFPFRHMKTINTHFALIGMAVVSENFPLYFDATNEKGLSMAGLLFSENAFYRPLNKECDNIPSFEFIPWILSQCENVADAKKLIEKINITDDIFSSEFPPSPLHWIIADRKESITVEALREGIFVHNNPVGVLTNNPPFPFQMFNLNNYMSLSNNPPENTFSEKINLSPYSRGMGAMGLPGDVSSASRFVRASFTKLNSVSEKDEKSCVNQFFHILGSVRQIRGLTLLENGLYEITQYSSCINTDKGLYYYTTYDNLSINCVNLYSTDLDESTLTVYPLE